jgi:hypothetical protein
MAAKNNQVPPDVRKYLSDLGRKGGAVKSEAKKRAAMVRNRVRKAAREMKSLTE